MSKSISQKEAAEAIMSSNGKIFTVVFTKRTTGEVRKMNCRIKVRKHLRGGAAAYSFTAKGLISVFNLAKAGYRCIPIEGISELRIGGGAFKVVD